MGAWDVEQYMSHFSGNGMFIWFFDWETSTPSKTTPYIV